MLGNVPIKIPKGIATNPPKKNPPTTRPKLVRESWIRNPSLNSFIKAWITDWGEGRKTSLTVGKDESSAHNTKGIMIDKDINDHLRDSGISPPMRQKTVGLRDSLEG